MDRKLDALEPKCPDCVDTALAAPKLITDSPGGDWRLGGDGEYHWRRLYKDFAICGVAVLAGNAWK